MPVVQRRHNPTAERAYQLAMDWCRVLMQLSALAVILILLYVLYGLIAGGAAEWTSLSPEARARIAQNIESAVRWFHIALGLFLVTSLVLFYDEEALGYTLILIAIALYFGVPFAMDLASPGLVTGWASQGNTAGLAAVHGLQITALMLAVPGAILTVRDIALRIAHGTSRDRERFTAMEFGGQVKEEKPPSPPIIGMFAKCWQLPFCREAIRKNCPIFHHRTRCWRERVGCMCEEKVIRHAMEALIEREDVELGAAGTQAATDMPTQPVAARIPAAARQVRIPHNPNLPMAVKRERCRNCVIYNEHQRMKYQFFAPIVLLAVPALMVWQYNAISTTLSDAMHTIDSVMSRLSLDPQASSLSIAQSVTSAGMAAHFLLIGCLIVIATTAALRFTEYCIFKIKI